MLVGLNNMQDDYIKLTVFNLKNNRLSDSLKHSSLIIIIEKHEKTNIWIEILIIKYNKTIKINIISNYEKIYETFGLI